ncbi:hypothetical protein JCM19046_3075 [Bacillus sp. JCM 19046]|nr:hypothetical protein JCM19046_3075 [Bacillus sp. JCM 19046]
MNVIKPTPYDLVAKKITELLTEGERTDDYLIEHLTAVISDLSGESVKDMLEMMKRLKLINRINNNVWMLSNYTKELLLENKQKISTLISSEQLPSFPQMLGESSFQMNIVEEGNENDTLSNLRREIEIKVDEYNKYLKLKLKEALLKVNAYRFEEIVIELLVKSGEGKSGIVTQKVMMGGSMDLFIRRILNKDRWLYKSKDMLRIQ